MRKKKNKRWAKIALALGVVLMVVLLILALLDKPQAQRKEDILERAARLELERDNLISKRDSLQQEYLRQKNHPATEHVLFLDLDSQLYTDAYPIMERAHVTGSLGLSESNFPGDPGKITREEFDELLEHGWDYCLVCGNGEDFTAWDSEMTRLLENAGLSKPKTVFFEKDEFDISLEEDILRCGYGIVVHHGEGRLSLLGKDSADELWLTGAQFWNYEGVKIDIQELVRFKGDKTFTVRFYGGYEKFSRTAFPNMLDYVSTYLSDGSLTITGYDQAREIHNPAVVGEGMTEEEWDKQRTEMDEQIQALNEQIQAIYDEWNDKK